jgi:hypothetical protein
MTDTRGQQIRRKLYSLAAACEIDKQGRILIPAQLRELAGLTKDATMLGVDNHVEIWNPPVIAGIQHCLRGKLQRFHGASFGGWRMSGEFRHIPVLLDETLTLLAPERGGTFVDGTLGGGGHAEAVLARLPQSGKLIGIDRDWEAVRAAEERLTAYGERFKTALHGNFFEMKQLLAEADVTEVNGILLDLGVSSYSWTHRREAFPIK